MTGEYASSKPDAQAEQIAALTKERDAAVDRAKVWEFNWNNEIAIKTEILSWYKEEKARAEAAEAKLLVTEKARQAMHRRAQVSEGTVAAIANELDIFAAAYTKGRDPSGHANLVIQAVRASIMAAAKAENDACEQAVKSCPSLDENGYICEKSAATTAIRKRQEQDK